MSRFVAAGGAEADDTSKDAAREDAWAKAQQQLEALRAKPKPQVGKQEDGKSLYEVLEANKAAKQAGFEEQAKLKNQFRALDDDEIDFLDAVVSRERAKENAVKKETADELESFRKQQQLAEKAPVAADSVNPEAAVPDTWRAKKRRRKDADTAIPKVRKLSDQQSKSPPAAVLGIRTAQPSKEPPVKVQTTAALGLAYGSSDDDDDDEDE